MGPKDLLILKNLKNSTHTANEVIEKIRKEDHETGVYRMSVHFYTHLNKRFDPLKKSNMLTHVGYKRGPSNRDEKTWALTKLAESHLANLEVQEQHNLAA